jgi:uncharacterized protein (TIGR02246 family)
MPHWTRLPLALTLLFVGLGPAHAQVLPIQREEASGIDQARYIREVRTHIEEQLQEWVNAWERGDAEAMSRFYVDDALIVDPSGEVVRGRAAVADYWASIRAEASELVVAVTQVSATTDVATARGRISYRVPSDGGGQLTRSGDLLLVFERQRGLWMTRVHAAVLDGRSQSVPVSTMRGAIRGTGRAPQVPAVAQLRWRLEPEAGVLRLGEHFGDASTGLVGLGAGMEIGRVFELHVGYAQGSNGGAPGGQPLRSVSGEVRLYGLPDLRVRPYVAAGLARVSGGAVGERLNGQPGGSGPVPKLGGGLGMDLSRGWGLHVDARNYLLLDPDGMVADHWFAASRTSNWSVSGGFSYTVGRARQWHDPRPHPARQVYEDRVRYELVSVMERWLDGLERGLQAHLPAIYATDAQIMLSDGRSVHGQPQIVEFWAGRAASPAGHLIVEDVRASGNVAAVVARVVPPGSFRQQREPASTGAVVTVFEQQRGEWVIKSQLLVEHRPLITGP